MKKILVFGFVFLFLISFAFAGDLENSGARIDFAIDSNTVSTGDYFINKDVIAVNSVGYTFEKDYQFIDTPICRQYEFYFDENNTKQQGDCSNWDTQQTLDKVVLAKLEFKECEEGSWYRITKSDLFSTSKDVIKNTGYEYDNLQCINGKISFEIDSFSSYTVEEVNAVEAKLFHYYTCDNVSGSTVYDEEGTNHGTEEGGVTFATDGVVGKACSFDGLQGTGIKLSEDFYAEFDDFTFSFNTWALTNQVTTQSYLFDLYGEMSSRGYLNGHVAGDYYNYMGVDSNTTLTGDWNMVTFVINSSDGGSVGSGLGNECVYINAELQSCLTDSIDLTIRTGADFNTIGSYRASPLDAVWDGLLDEIAFFTEPLTIEEMEIIYNISKAGYHLYDYSTVEANVTYDNVSYLGIGVEIPDYTLTSSDYILFDSYTFNTSNNHTNLGFLDDYNFLKTTGVGDSVISMNLTVDDASLFEGVIITVTKNEAVVSGAPPLFINVSNGEHTVNRYIKKTGVGGIDIYNAGFSMGQFVSSAGNDGRGNLTDVETNFSSSSFSSVFSKTINKNVESSTYIAGTFAFTSSLATDVVCKFVDGGDSPFMIVSLDGSSTRSVSTNYITSPETTSETLNISCKSTNGVNVDMNGSFIEVDLRDDSNNLINNHFFTNTSTNYTSYVDITAGHTDYLKEEIKIENGTNILISQSISFDSQSGAQTPTFHVNVTNSGAEVCYFEKERYSDGDIGNVFSYPLCEGLDAGSSYNVTLGIDVPTGETIRVYDEALSIFENTIFDVTVQNTPPTLSITAPGTNTSHQDSVLIVWSYFDVQSDVSNLILNITNSTNTTTVFTGNTSTVSYLLNLSGQSDGDITINLYGTEIGTTELYNSSDSIIITVTSDFVVSDSFSVGVCPVEDVPTSLMFFTICIVLCVFALIGFMYKSPLIIILSGLGIAFSSLYVVGCMGSIGYIFMGLGVGTMLYAIFMKF